MAVRVHVAAEPQRPASPERIGGIVAVQKTRVALRIRSVEEPHGFGRAVGPDPELESLVERPMQVVGIDAAAAAVLRGTVHGLDAASGSGVPQADATRGIRVLHDPEMPVRSEFDTIGGLKVIRIEVADLAASRLAKRREPLAAAIEDEHLVRHAVAERDTACGSVQTQPQRSRQTVTEERLHLKRLGVDAQQRIAADQNDVSFAVGANASRRRERKLTQQDRFLVLELLADDVPAEVPAGTGESLGNVEHLHGVEGAEGDKGAVADHLEARAVALGWRRPVFGVGDVRLRSSARHDLALGLVLEVDLDDRLAFLEPMALAPGVEGFARHADLGGVREPDAVDAPELVGVGVGLDERVACFAEGRQPHAVARTGDRPRRLVVGQPAAAPVVRVPRHPGDRRGEVGEQRLQFQAGNMES